jgi:hypothetical protein
MTATLIGELTLGDAVPGIRDALVTVGDGLRALKAVTDAQIGLIRSAQSEINGLAADLDAAKSDLISGPLDEFQAAVDAAQGALDDLVAIADAPAWLTGLIGQLDAARALLVSLDPSSHLADMIAAVQGGVNGAQARLDSLAATLDSMTDISGLVSAQTAALGLIADALSAASTAAIGALAAYAEQVSQLLASGVAVVHFVGTTGNFGGEVDSAIAGSSLSPAGASTGLAMLVSATNPTTVANFKALFGIS